MAHAPVRDLARFEKQDTGTHWRHRWGAARVAPPNATAVSVQAASNSTLIDFPAMLIPAATNTKKGLALADGTHGVQGLRVARQSAARPRS